jgi:hypothetical protein
MWEIWTFRYFGPMRDEIAPPRRPMPGRRPGRPRNDLPEEEVPEQVATLAPPLSSLASKALDYSNLEAWMTHADEVIRSTRRSFDRLALSKLV